MQIATAEGGDLCGARVQELDALVGQLAVQRAGEVAGLAVVVPRRERLDDGAAARAGRAATVRGRVLHAHLAAAHPLIRAHALLNGHLAARGEPAGAWVVRRICGRDVEVPGRALGRGTARRQAGRRAASAPRVSKLNTIRGERQRQRAHVVCGACSTSGGISW